MKETDMKVQIHGEPIFSKRGARAQIIVLVGEGRNRNSITKHAQRRVVGPNAVGYFGLNPDERAIPLNEQYEAELAEANSKLTIAEAALANLEKKLGMANEATPETEIDEIANADTMVILSVMIQKCKLEIVAAIKAVDDADKKLAIVQRDLPLEVEFVGPGLTY